MLLQLNLGGAEGGLVLIALVILAVWCITLVAIANGRFNDNTTKLCWLLIVLFLNIIGVILFAIWGRKEVYNKAS